MCMTYIPCVSAKTKKTSQTLDGARDRLATFCNVSLSIFCMWQTDSTWFCHLENAPLKNTRTKPKDMPHWRGQPAASLVIEPSKIIFRAPESQHTWCELASSQHAEGGLPCVTSTARGQDVKRRRSGSPRTPGWCSLTMNYPHLYTIKKQI